MTAVIETEKLTKSYGPHRGIVDVDLEVNEGEAFGFLGPNGAGQDDDDPDAARPHPADERAGDDLRHRDDRRSGRDPSPPRLPARRVRAVRQAHRRPDARVLRQPARRRRRGLPAGPDRPARRRPVAEVPRVLEGQQAEDRADHRPPASARPAPARRADVRPRPAHPAGVLRGHPRGEGRGPDGLPLVAHPVRGREDLRPGGDHPRRPPGARRPDRGAARPGPPPGRAGVHRRGPGRRSSASLPGVSPTSSPRTTSSACASPAASRPVVRAAARYELADFVSREPSLEETFLAEYGKERGRGGAAMTDRSAGRPRPPHRPGAAIYGFGSIFAKTVRDSRRATIVAAGVLALVFIGVSRAITAEFDTPQSRDRAREPRQRRAADPAGHGRQGRQRRDAGRLPPVQVRRLLPARRRACGRSSRCRARSPARRSAAASSSCRRPADRADASRSRSCRATSSMLGAGRARRVRLDRHRRQRVRGRCPATRSASLSAFGYAVWLGLLALAAGALAFALAPVRRPRRRGGHRRLRSRSPGSSSTATRAPVPELAPFANLTWWGWTVEPHRAGRPVRLAVGRPRGGRDRRAARDRRRGLRRGATSA